MDYRDKWVAALSTIQKQGDRIRDIKRERDQLLEFRQQALEVVPDLESIIRREYD